MDELSSKVPPIKERERIERFYAELKAKLIKPHYDWLTENRCHGVVLVALVEVEEGVMGLIYSVGFNGVLATDILSPVQLQLESAVESLERAERKAKLNG